jgi:hypothetical protein
MTAADWDTIRAAARQNQRDRSSQQLERAGIAGCDRT